MFVVRRAQHGAAVPQQYLHLLHRLVHQPVAEGGGFNAAPDGRAADGDGFELRHHRRHDVVFQAFGDELRIRRHALDHDMAVHGIDVQDIVEIPHIQLLRRPAMAVTKQVGGGFSEAYVFTPG